VNKTRGAFGFALTFSLLLSFISGIIFFICLNECCAFVLRQKKVKTYGVLETSFDWKIVEQKDLDNKN